MRGQHEHRPNTLRDAPLQYAPRNELGVVYLFAHVAKKLQLRIEEIRPKFPDCIAYRRVGDSEKRIRIEFEFKSSNFKTHKHNQKDCDWIVCWHDDWPDAPSRLHIESLKKHFGAEPKIWIQPAIKSQWSYLGGHDEINWALSKRATQRDLLLMYRCYPEKSIRDVFVLDGELTKGKADWRKGDCYGGLIKRVCNLEAPIFLEDMRMHRVLKTSSFIRSNMQGNLLVSEYWPYLYEIIVARNPRAKRFLTEWHPEKL
ncbi:hypothetical protein HY230_01000 [Candidatus Acetothermia bacterium]|nr:hypothetical protein [Candidatus Acetothermia bacterium]